MTLSKEQLNLVIVGHVDHGKSTFLGRLLHDTNSLPEGKLEQVKAVCKRNSKPFEYAFLLDALKDEQSQGITIDTARCFFNTDKRHYIIFDAPGHIEFLKNMVTGAGQAEAAILLIDAKEGVKENSRRHGFLLSLLGIKQIIVLVNKMDLVDFSEDIFNKIKTEYTAFLKEINVNPIEIIPISAFNGDNMVTKSEKSPWYKGKSVIDHIDLFKKEAERTDKAFRFPVQDIYKFTEESDDRRIVAGTVRTGAISKGDKVLFLPSKKESTVTSIEQFNAPVQTTAESGQSVGFTLDTQLYVKPGEVMVKASESNDHPFSSTTFKANIFWLGKQPMIKNKKYKLKLASARESVYLKEIVNVMDASELTSTSNQDSVNRHDVGECIFQTIRPVSFDLATDFEFTGRFVIVDGYEIAGGGIITQAIESDSSQIQDFVSKRDYAWEKSAISSESRYLQYNHKAKFIVITGPDGSGKMDLAKTIEERLFNDGKKAYFMGISNMLSGVSTGGVEDRDEHIRSLGEVAHLFTDSGQIFISTVSNLDDVEAEILKELTKPNDIVVINIGESRFNDFPVHLQLDTPINKEDALSKIYMLLQDQLGFSNYSI
jgi:bifunctional enzyme CysN/CysC